MGQGTKSNIQRMLLPFGTALLLGVGLHDLFVHWPSILTEFIAPVNESIWEHVKIVFWPLLFVEFAFYPKEHRPNGLTAILLSCTGLLLVGWTYHVVLCGTLLAVDIGIFCGAVAAYFLLAALLNIPKGWVSILAGVYILVIGVILAFTITPPHGTLFNDPNLADAWVHMNC